MRKNDPQATVTQTETPVRVPLSPAAERALAEAEARTRAYREQDAAQPKEHGGRGGKEPVRYGDWEVKGLASDF
ncbi:DUF1674 domain-containing protein [Mesorhizobium sp. KR9-304]|uniref:DUF1674 domain-containing protein n=1 Tax=Mesorhizobium sp. KR9-304 TaxID=3156614 RepID=UPI0032B49B78